MVRHHGYSQQAGGCDRGISSELENSYYERGLKADSEGAGYLRGGAFPALREMYGCRRTHGGQDIELSCWSTDFVQRTELNSA